MLQDWSINGAERGVSVLIFLFPLLRHPFGHHDRCRCYARGALTIPLNTLFWNPCMVQTFVDLEQPHSWQPYDHTGFSI